MTAWVRLRLDLDTWDVDLRRRLVESAEAQGATLTTLAALGNTRDHQRRLYELNRECSADIPERGAFYTWEEYAEQRIDVPSFDPRGVVVAQDGNRWVGMMALSDHSDEGHAFLEMTGVVRDWRRRGLSRAMKAYGATYADLIGVPVLRTFHHPDNAAAIAANRSLGFVDDD